MKEISILAVLVSFVFACSAPPSNRADEDVATAHASLEALADGSYPVSVCGLRYEHGHAVTVRSADGKLFVVSPDAAFGRPPTLVIPVNADGSFSMVDYRARTGGQVHTISGSVSIAGNVLSLHYRASWDFFDVTVAGRGIGSPRIATEIDGDGDGTYDLATGATSTCTVKVQTVTLTGSRTSSVPPRESAVSVSATLREWGAHRTISISDFDNVPIDADGAFSIEIPNPNGGSRYLRGTARAGVIQASYGTSSTIVTFDEQLTGFYNP
jgi:hypothetical protein